MNSPARASLSEVPRLQGRYEFKSEVGRGGMGVVYRAYDGLGAREVAYKRLLVPDGGVRADLVALFQREYNTLAQLAHPAIVDVYEYGFDDVGPFYTMELLTGKGLTELAPLPVKELCRVMRDVASALALLHARRLVHRDLSPANVRVNVDGQTKLIDFGALVPFGPAPDVVGTPAFMAPESFERGVLDQRADLYALGALAYWGLTRRTAVRARSLADLPMAWLDTIVPPTHHVPEIPKALEELVLSLLSRDPLARPASAAEVMERLTTIGELSTEPEEQKVAASYMANPPLVGRARQLAEVESALRALRNARSQSFLMESEPGLGRSALLDDITVRAQLDGATVLRADAAADVSAFGLGRSLVRVALALYPDLLGSAGSRNSEFKQLSLQAVARVEAARSAVQASEQQAQQLALMEEILLKASAKNRMVIVVDQLHRADAQSLALLAALAVASSDQALMLVLASNRGALTSDAYAKIRASSEPIRLEPLTEEDSKELTDTIFGRAANNQRLAVWLHQRSGGNPARCMDLMRLLLQAGIIHYTTGTFTLPHDVGPDVAWEDSGAALLSRLADLSSLARETATVLSLQDTPLPVQHLARTVGAEMRDLVLALEELSARAIVGLADGCAALLNTSLRDALSTRLSDEQRRVIHVRAARAILSDANLDGTLRMQAGMHLLKAGEESEAVELLMTRGPEDFLNRFLAPVDLLESVLEVLRRQGRSDEQCLAVLVPLVRGGFFGDLPAHRRHLDRTLQALANVCGITTMAKLTPRVGPKLALIVGLVSALVRHAFTPKAMRYGSYPETVAALLSILSATTAACACAFEAKQAFEITRMFAALRTFGPDSAPYWSIEFCSATAEAGAARYAASRARYERLRERFTRPLKGMSEENRQQFQLGTLHGLAQCMVADTDPACLALADEIEARDMFFAPHAATVRMGYHGYRGEMDLCEEHRRRGEMLALRGGISWSSVTLMTVRTAYMAINTSDVVALVRVTSELERLSGLAPKTLLYRDAVRAALELLRGRPQRAVESYEQLFASPDAEHMIAHFADRTMYAKALSALGRHAEAQKVCEDLLAGLGPAEVLYVRKGPLQQIALARAALGDVESATNQLDELITELEPYDNPLWTGTAHRDRAKVALFAEDHAGFQKHLSAMTHHYQATKNPALIQQCELLQTAARALRARTPRALDDAAIAFETDQARISEAGGMDTFTTESLSEPPPANRQPA